MTGSGVLLWAPSIPILICFLLLCCNIPQCNSSCALNSTRNSRDRGICRIIVNFSPRRTGFESTSVYMRFMLIKVTLQYISPSTLVSPTYYHSINWFTGIYHRHHHYHHPRLVACLANVLDYIRQHELKEVLSFWFPYRPSRTWNRVVGRIWETVASDIWNCNLLHSRWDCTCNPSSFFGPLPSNILSKCVIICLAVL